VEHDLQMDNFHYFSIILFVILVLYIMKISNRANMNVE